MSFENIDVVVTGGTGDLGQAVVGLLLEQGATCHIPNLVAAELEGFAHRGHERVRIAEGVDLTDAGQVAAFYERLPPIGASIHLAGGFLFAPVAETSAADFEKQWRMNAQTCFHCCQAAIAAFRGQDGGGRIVNVTARPGLEPRQGASMAAYTAAKAAVAALTEALAEETAKEDILINAVAPSILDTPANRSAMPKADHRQWPKLEEVARTIVFLAGPENRVTRGGLVPVYGRF
ncbi:SDR family NAD(P)-dependent oxidoreductase [Minwuia thermotolerans]|uniref:Short-chain dehydrogenase n=1 Tax=Minwuia thermotolerans TaxID=2056226 RepID=A0A2M9FXK0_9PROT|nr:SDR family NAD(P)-dependent oxidoreductase [Minwuia thermotolerans]PJK28183.1 short-chain dehydrogenase [Minwuia thermotolerans]